MPNCSRYGCHYREEIRNCGRGVERVGRAIRQLPDREVAESETGAERMNAERERDKPETENRNYF